MPDLIADLYRQNEWANLRVLELCRDLDDAQLDSTAVGTYGSIRSTLHHIVGAETGYAFRTGAAIERLRGDDPWPGFDALESMVKTTAEHFIGAAARITDATIRVGGDDEPYEVEPSVILVQVLNHSTEHRSQIFSILTGLGIEPPELSGWEWGVAAGKMWRV